MAHGPLRRSLTALACVLAGQFSGSRVEAQETERSDSAPLVEETARVVVRFRGGAAEVTTTRTVRNRATRPEELFFAPEAPRGGAFVGLSSPSPGGTLTASLVPSLLARTAYETATGFAPREGSSRDPLLAFLDASHQLTVQAFPVPPGAPKTIRYQWLAPTRWERGEDRFELPAPGSDAYELIVEADPASDLLRFEEQVLAGGAPQRAVSGLHPLSRVRAGFSAGVAGHATLLPLSAGSGQTWVRARFELAPRLEAVPARSALVIVVDDSRSVTPAERSLALGLADSYVAGHTRGGTPRVAVIRFDRRAHAETADWVGADEARSVLARMRAHGPSRAHGSRLDAAMTLATTWLDALPDDLAKRVLVLSDGRLSREAARSVPSPRHAVVHAVRTSATVGDSRLAPETGPLSGWVESTGGLSWSLRREAESSEPEEALSEPLVRADVLRDAVLRAPGLARHVGELAEGEGLTLDEARPARGRSVVLEGALWSRRVRYVAETNEGSLRAEAALASVSAHRAGRTPDEVAILARLGGAVSGMTAYLGLEPGARAGRQGVHREPEMDVFLGGGWDLDPHASLDGLGLSGSPEVPDGMFFQPTDLPLTSTGEGAGPETRRALALEIALRSAARACGAHGILSARIETTLDEIVDVAAAPCLAEALWQTTVPLDDAPEHAVTEVTLAAL